MFERQLKIIIQDCKNFLHYSTFYNRKYFITSIYTKKPKKMVEIGSLQPRGSILVLNKRNDKEIGYNVTLIKFIEIKIQ
jgi:hypothetical protein